MTTLTNKEIIKSISSQINRVKRHFKRDKAGNPRGAGLEIVGKTSKVNADGALVIWHTLQDSRRVCFVIQVEQRIN